MSKQERREYLLGLISGYELANGKLPRVVDIREAYGVCDKTFARCFGSWRNALRVHNGEPIVAKPTIFPTTLVVPDAHVGPGQSMERFDALAELIRARRPTRIIFMGDFVTLEALSNWDLQKSGIMEGRRYQEDVEAGSEALRRSLQYVDDYSPEVIYLKGNHCTRLDRYIETKPELSGHLDLVRDMKIMEHGVTKVIEYRDSIEYDGVIFTHAPQNAANQPVSGKYAIHRAAEMLAKSTVFGHTHRKESVNYYRHGADDITQILMCGAFFEHTDSYAYGGLNSYWRGLCLLTHWAPGRFDAEEISLERLKMLYPTGGTE